MTLERKARRATTTTKPNEKLSLLRVLLAASEPAPLTTAYAVRGPYTLVYGLDWQAKLEKLCAKKTTYQRNLLAGHESWKGSTLTGRAGEKSGRCRDSRGELCDALQRAGIPHELRGKFLVVGTPPQVVSHPVVPARIVRSRAQRLRGELLAGAVFAENKAHGLLAEARMRRGLAAQLVVRKHSRFDLIHNREDEAA